MDKAIIVFSRKGLFQKTLSAFDIRSREHARKLWPLVSFDESMQMVTWVSPSFQNGRLRRRAHFRFYLLKIVIIQSNILIIKKIIVGIR